MRFTKVCAMLAAHSLRQAGVTVAEIARQADKHPITIRRWLRNF